MILFLLLLSGIVFGAQIDSPLQLVSKKTILSSPLTNAFVLESQPELVSPHRRGWAIKIKLSWRGLAIDPRAPTRVKAQAMESEILGAWRGTQENLNTLQTQMLHYEKTLQKKLPKLEIELKKIKDKNELHALLQANQLLTAFEQEQNQNIQKQMDQKDVGILSKSNVRESWREKMEAPGEPVAQYLAPLLRAPAKRYDGFFSIRLTLNIRGIVITGPFLIDPKIPISQIDPTFLKDSGIPLKKLLTKESVLKVNEVLAGGKTIKEDARFILSKTQRFYPPRQMDVCCAGILGSDLLNRYAVEFIPTHPAAVQFYEPKQFGYRSEAHWIELMKDPVTGELFSPQESSTKSAAKSAAKLTWDSDFFSKGALSLDLPNGRLWFSKEIENFKHTKPSGLTFKFRWNPESKRIRELVLFSIKPKTWGAIWAKREQVFPGTVFTKINDENVAFYDEKEVHELLNRQDRFSKRLSWRSKSPDGAWVERTAEFAP